MNIFTATGNLGRDAEQRFSTAGNSIVSFSLPVKSGYGDKEATSWLKCTVFGKQGESVLPYLKKGQLVGISGEFVASEYTDKDGNKKTSNEIKVQTLKLLGKASRDDSSPRNTPTASVAELTDDVPF